MTQLLILFVTSIILLVYYFISRNFNYWKSKNIPGPKPMLLFGNIKDTVIRKKNASETFQEIYNQFPDEAVVGMFRMTSPCLLVRDLDVIKNIMIRDFDVFESRGIEFSKEGLGENLFHADGDTWRTLRHKFTPIFTTGKLKDMAYLIVEECDKFVKFLEDSVKMKPEQEMYFHMKRYTISAIATCVFGISIDTLNEPLMTTLAEVDRLTVEANIFHEIDMMFPRLLKRLNLSLFPSKVQKFFDDMVSNIIKERNGKSINRKDFMDLILELREQGKVLIKNQTKNREVESFLQFSDSVIAAQAFIFYAAGYETSATILSYFLYELAQNSKIQDKVIQEVDEVLKKHKGQITYKTLQDLDYIEKCFNETYRKYPIIPLQRRATVDYKIPGTDITIEKDTFIIVSTLGIHYDEKYYQKPKIFDPERFNYENSKDRHPCAFMPFGVGPRHCIGARFAKITTRIGALKILSKFHVEPSPITSDIEFDANRVVASPSGGIYLKLTPRTPQILNDC